MKDKLQGASEEKIRKIARRKCRESAGLPVYRSGKIQIQRKEEKVGQAPF